MVGLREACLSGGCSKRPARAQRLDALALTQGELPTVSDSTWHWSWYGPFCKHTIRLHILQPETIPHTDWQHFLHLM